MITFIRQKSIMVDSLCLIAGCLLPLAFAPLSFYFLAPFSIAFLWYGWLNVSPRRTLFRGWLFGLGFFGIGVSWIYISIHRFGEVPVPLSVFITFLFVSTLALFPAISGWVSRILFPRASIYKLLAVFPTIWVLAEWIRGWLFTGFPWLYLGASQIDSPLRGYIPLIGEYGVSFLVAFSASVLFLIAYKVKDLFHFDKRYLKRLIPVFYLIALIAVWWIGGLLARIHWTKPMGDPIKISVIQGNIPQEVKWRPDQVSSTLNTYQQLTKWHLNRDLILWPEAAVPVPLPYAAGFIAGLAKKVERYHTHMILGIPIQADNQHFYNAALVLGDKRGIYAKRRLVPFGEYVPFERWFGGFMDFLGVPISDLISGPRHQSRLFIGEVPVALYICYEVAYAEWVRSDLPEAQLLITLTNDAWFGESIAPDQHLQIARLRSLETGRYMICSTNDGITAIIGPDGWVINALPQFKAGVLMGDVYAMKGTTPWVRYGTWTIMLVIGMLFLIVLIGEKRRISR